MENIIATHAIRCGVSLFGRVCEWVGCNASQPPYHRIYLRMGPAIYVYKYNEPNGALGLGRSTHAQRPEAFYIISLFVILYSFLFVLLLFFCVLGWECLAVPSAHLHFEYIVVYIVLFVRMCTLSKEIHIYTDIKASK